MVITGKQRKLSLTLVGDGMVGKTSLINAFLGNKFSEKYTATTSDVYSGSMLHYGERYDITIYDLPGERDNDVMSTQALRESEVIIVSYSIDDRESFDSIRSFWIPLISKMKSKPMVFLAGLQSDKRSACNGNTDFITKQEGLLLLREINAEGFYECSAQKGDRVKQIFSAAVDATMKSRKKKVNLIKRAFGR